MADAGLTAPIKFQCLPKLIAMFDTRGIADIPEKFVETLLTTYPTQYELVEEGPIPDTGKEPMPETESKPSEIPPAEPKRIPKRMKSEEPKSDPELEPKTAEFLKQITE